MTSPLPSVTACTHGLTPARMSRKGVSLSTKTGRHMPGASDTCASDSRQSSSAAQPTALRHSVNFFEKSAKRLDMTPPSARSLASLATSQPLTSCSISAVQKRFVPFFDDFISNSSGVPRRLSVSSLTASWKGSVVDTCGVQNSILSSRSSCRQWRSCVRSSATAFLASASAASYGLLAPGLGMTRPSFLAASQSKSSRNSAMASVSCGKPSPCVSAAARCGARSLSSPSRCGCARVTAASSASKPSSTLTNMASFALPMSS